MSETSTLRPPAAYIIVCSKEGGDPVELPLETDSSLKLSTLQIEYTGAQGIKYRNPATGVFRVMAPMDERIFPPAGGWTDAHYIACCPKGAHEDRPWLEGVGGPPAAKMMRMGEVGPPAHWGQDLGDPNFAHLGPRGARTGPPPGGHKASPITGNLVDPVTGRPAFAHCALCDTYLNSPDQSNAHFAGKKHKEKEAAAAGGFGARGGFGPPRGRGGGRGGFPGRGGGERGRGGDRGRGGGRGGFGGPPRGGGGYAGGPPGGPPGGWSQIGEGPGFKAF